MHYLDANPLMRWAEAQAASGDERSTAAAARVEEVISANGDIAISEVTLIEYHDNVSAYHRNNQPGDHDDAWLERVQTQLMQWIADEQLQVLAPFPRMFETAMSYITLAHRQGRALRVWDAVHLCRATEWAREASAPVTILTGDRDFEQFLELFPKLRDFVAIERIGIATA